MYQATIIISQSNTCEVSFAPSDNTVPVSQEVVKNGPKKVGVKVVCQGPKPFLGLLTRYSHTQQPIETKVIGIWNQDIRR